MRTLTAEDIEHLWALEPEILTERQQRALPRLHRWMSGRRDDPLAQFLSGGEPLQPSVELPASIQRLTNDLLARFRSSAEPPDRPIDWAIAGADLFGKLIDRGNALKLFTLCPPPIPYLERREPSPFERVRWRQRDIAPALRALLSKPLNFEEATSSNEAAQARLGQLLLSAVVHGGMIHSSSLQTMVSVLSVETPALQGTGHRLYMELSLGWRGQADAEFRRWFPDPLTTALILTLPSDTVAAVQESLRGTQVPSENSKTTPTLTTQELWRCIKRYFRWRSLKAVDFPSSLSTLIDAVQLDLETRVPPMLVNFAGRRLVSHSLKPAVWTRLHGQKTLPSDKGEPTDEADGAIEGIGGDTQPAEEAEPRWLLPLRRALVGADRSVILERLRPLVSTPDSSTPLTTGALFAGFAHHLLTSARSGGKYLAVATARAYALSSARRLGGILGVEPVGTMAGDEWAAFYAEVLDDAETPGMRRRLTRVLREFHRYLQDALQTDPIDAREVFGLGDGLVPVDANLLGPEEFRRVRQALLRGTRRRAEPEIIAIADLVFTLAYRCGFRRMEVLKLEIADITLDAPAELLVRPTEARRLKTKNATRKSPVHALLEEDELTRLKDWTLRRRAEEAVQPYSPFLFGVPRLDLPFVPQDTLFPIIHDVMREVTGDHGLRFHHLRHSFASWTFYRLMSSDVPDEVTSLSHVPEIDRLNRSIHSFRSALYRNRWLTRRHVYACTALLGHSGPDVSLEHYIHLADGLLAAYLDQPGLSPRLAAVVTASGHSTASAYAHGANRSPYVWLVHLWKKRYEMSSLPAIHVVSKEVQSYRQDEEILFRAWRMIQSHELDMVGVEELSDRFGFTKPDIELMLARSRAISAITISEGGSALRHRFVDRVVERRPKKKTVRTALPVDLPDTRDREIADRYMRAVVAYAASDPDLSLRIFGYFVAHARENFSGMIFKDPNQPDAAADLVRWYRAVGVSLGELRFTGFDVTRERSRAMGVWRKGLRLPGEALVVKQVPLNGNPKWACPWLGIDAIFPVGNPSGQSDSEAPKNVGTSAFRYFWIMGAIVFGYELPK